MTFTSLGEQILVVISEYEQELSQFTQQVRACKSASVNSNFQDLLPALDKVFAKDKQLQDCFKQVDLQQNCHNNLAKLEERRHELEAQVNSLKDEMFVALYDIKLRIQHEGDKLGLLKHLAQNGLNIDVTIASAQRLSLTEAPPPGWRPEYPLILHRPPYPTEDLMRASLLFKTMNVGERETQNTSIQPVIPEPGRATAPSPPDRRYSHDAEEQSMLLDLDLNPDLV